MPASAVKPGQEKYWERAKKRAEEEGHAGDYAYIMGIFKRMTVNKSMAKSFIIPSRFTGVRQGSMVPGRERELMKLVERKPPAFKAAMLLDHTEPRSGPYDIVKGLFGPDMTKQDEWAKFLEKTFASSVNELTLRKALFQKAREDKLGPEQSKALFQRSINFWRDMKKSMVEIVPLVKAEARGGTYHKRVRTEKGGYRYYYDEDKYKSSKHHQESGPDAQKAYISKTISGMVEKSGTKGCEPKDMKTLVKKYGAKAVSASLRESCAEGGSLAFKGGRFYSKAGKK